jgi:hypothetical protein
LNSTITYIHEFEKNPIPYTKEELLIIDTGFQNLTKMDGISPRCHNAIYFLFLAFHHTHWIVSFMFLMNTLEAIFSKDTPGAATETICTRVSSILESKPGCNFDDIFQLYEIRSRIVHGNIVANKEPIEYLKHLHHLQDIVIECMKKLLNERIYSKFEDKETRDSYLGTLNTCR